MVNEANKSTLTKLGIEVKYFLVRDINNIPIRLVCVGGLEVIGESKGLKDIEDKIKEYGVSEENFVCDEESLLPFKYVENSLVMSHLDELVKMRKTSNLSKEQASRYEVSNKGDLVNKKVYIHESNPSTNSIALAEQFQLKHFHVIEQIFKLAEQNPSVLMGIEYGIYEVSDNTQSPENQTIEHSVDSNLGVSTFRTFLHISEDVYYKFISSLGTPKSDRMKVYRDTKREEYFKAFQSLRQVLNDSGIKDKEIESLLKRRTAGTKELMEAIYDYTKHHNNLTHTTKQITRINAIRFMFNLINYKNEINSINYVPEEPKEGETRKTKSEVLQEKLLILESRILGALKIAKLHKVKFQEAVLTSIDMTIEEATHILEEYNVKHLLTLTKG